jgi:hypothetical protein
MCMYLYEEQLLYLYTCGIGEAGKESKETGHVSQQPGRGRVGHVAAHIQEAGTSSFHMY